MVQAATTRVQPVQPTVQPPVRKTAQTETSFAELLDNRTQATQKPPAEETQAPVEKEPPAKAPENASKDAPKTETGNEAEKPQDADNTNAEGETPKAEEEQPKASPDPVIQAMLSMMQQSAAPQITQAQPMVASVPVAAAPTQAVQEVQAAAVQPQQAVVSTAGEQAAPATQTQVPVTQALPTVQGQQMPQAGNTAIPVQAQAAVLAQAAQQAAAPEQAAQVSTQQAVVVENSSREIPAAQIQGDTAGIPASTVKQEAPKLTPVQADVQQAQPSQKTAQTSAPVIALSTAKEGAGDDAKPETGEPKAEQAAMSAEAPRTREPIPDHTAIKISDAASKLTEPQKQLADTIQMNLREGNREFVMQLHPRELGQVQVRLFTQNGALHVELTASNPKTQQMLMSGAEALKTVLQDNNQSTVHVNAQTGQEQARQDFTQQQSGSNARERQQDQQREHQDQAWKQQEQVTTADFMSMMRGIQL